TQNYALSTLARITHHRPTNSVAFVTTTSTTIPTLSLHDALPISDLLARGAGENPQRRFRLGDHGAAPGRAYHQRAEAESPLRILDRKSTRLNSSHRTISYAVFCLKKKNTNKH